jgi:hypothetical protein
VTVDLGAAERLANVNIDAVALQAATQMIASHVVAKCVLTRLRGDCAPYDKVSAKGLAEHCSATDGPTVRFS